MIYGTILSGVPFIALSLYCRDKPLLIESEKTLLSLAPLDSADIIAARLELVNKLATKRKVLRYVKRLDILVKPVW